MAKRLQFIAGGFLDIHITPLTDELFNKCVNELDSASSTSLYHSKVPFEGGIQYLCKTPNDAHCLGMRCSDILQGTERKFP